MRHSTIGRLRKFGFALISTAIFVGGCGSANQCASARTSAGLGGCPAKRAESSPAKTSADTAKSVCVNFYSLDDPFKKNNATVSEKLAYAKSGYQCALNQGMVPISPRFNLPALDCPWIREVDATSEVVPTETNVYVIGVTNGNNAIAPANYSPAAFSARSQNVENQFAEHGYLLTAFDTPRGVRYVIIESEREFNPQTRLADVEKDFGSLVSTLQELDGKIVVYLTSYPLISAADTETPRPLRDLEINGVRRALDKRAADVSFVNWQ